MPSLGPLEILVIFVVALLVFGPDKMPEIGRQVARGVREFRRVQQTPSSELRNVAAEFDDDDADHVDAEATSSPAQPAGDPVPTLPAKNGDASDPTADASLRTRRVRRVVRHRRAPPSPASPSDPRARAPMPTVSPRLRSRRTRLNVLVRRRSNPDGRMTVVEHLAELRTRLFISLIAIALGATICFIFAPQIISFLVEFYRNATADTPNELIFTGPLDAFATRLKIATYGGIVLALPVWLWELWRFITPGPEPEREAVRGPVRLRVDRAVRAAAAVVALLTLQPALNFLLNIGGADLQPLLTADKYISLVGADDRGVRDRVRVPGRAGVPPHRRVSDHGQLRRGAGGRSCSSWCSPP